MLSGGVDNGVAHTRPISEGKPARVALTPRGEAVMSQMTGMDIAEVRALARELGTVGDRLPQIVV